MKTLAEIRQRLTAVKAEMRTLYDTAKASGAADLEGEALTKWDALKAEEASLTAAEARALDRDRLDRESPPADRPTLPAPVADGEIRFLTPEQRMTDLAPAAEAPLSIGRVVKGIATGDWSGAEAEYRTMGSAAGLGGYLIPQPLSANLLDLVRNNTAAIAAGASTIPMTAPTLKMVRVLNDPTAAWRTEGTAIPESDATFESLLLEAYSVAALCRINAELMEDVPQFSAQIESQLSAALGLEIDRVAFYGSGTPPQPRGLRTQIGVQEIDHSAPLADYDVFLDAIAALENVNATARAIVMAPRSKNALAKLKTGIAGDLTKLTPPPDFNALRRVVSNQIPTNEAGAKSSIFIGDFSNLAIGLRSSLQIEASKTAADAFGKNQVLIRAIARVGVCVLRPSHLLRIINVE